MGKAAELKRLKSAENSLPVPAPHTAEIVVLLEMGGDTLLNGAEKIAATFESYWNLRDFEPYDAAQKERLAQALKAEKHLEGDNPTYTFDILPYSYQQEILDKLEAERKADRWLEDPTSAETVQVGRLLDQYEEYLKGTNQPAMPPSIAASSGCTSGL